MMVKMRAIGSYVFHERLVRPGDIIIGTTSEYDWLRGADCAVKIGDVEVEVETQMIDSEKRTERRVGRSKR
jgi:hypothetical protein